MALPMEAKVEKFAIFSRCAVLFFQVIFNVLVPDYPDPTAFNPPRLPESKTAFDRVVKFLFGGLRHWDANYFLHVAEHGYSYEKSLAFFPLFPLITRGVANTLFYPLQTVLAYHNVLLLSAALVNFFVFVKSARVLYSLGCRVLQDKRLAYKAALLYCINPASIFFSVPYSETTFAYLCFTGLLHLECSSAIFSAVYFGFAFLTRSNGLVTFGFLIYHHLKNLINGIHTLMLNKTRDIAPFIGGLITLCAISLMPLFIGSLLFVLPFVIFQIWTFRTFCGNQQSEDYRNYTVQPHIIKYGLDMGEEFRFPWNGPFPWCNNTIPISYSYIQNHYWKVGFMTYYTVNNIPNFCLALPVVILCVCAAKQYYEADKRHVLALGLWDDWSELVRRKKDDDAPKTQNTAGYFSGRCFVYVAHMTALVVFGVTVIHIQVITRLLLSSCPVIYWYAAMVMTPGHTPGDCHDFDVVKRAKNEQPIETAKNQGRYFENLITDQILNFRQNNVSSKLIILYFLAYFIVGTLMFCNSLPWT